MAQATLHLWHSLTQCYQKGTYHLTKMARNINGTSQKLHLTKMTSRKNGVSKFTLLVSEVLPTPY